MQRFGGFIQTFLSSFKRIDMNISAFSVEWLIHFCFQCWRETLDMMIWQNSNVVMHFKEFVLNIISQIKYKYSDGQNTRVVTLGCLRLRQ